MIDSLSGSAPDEVPIADAVEQMADALPGQTPEPLGEGVTPLETSESDWREEQLVVEDPEEDVR